VVTPVANYLPEECHSVASGVEAVDLDLVAAPVQAVADVYESLPRDPL
jgi:hypothetical protein